ncbi:MAG: hypothetical protein ACXWZM_11640 [Solirubrobacterales bacterium]
MSIVFARVTRRGRWGGLAAAATLLTLLVSPTPASPEGQIVVRGAASGSHLRLTVGRKRIVVRGYMAASRPRGCRFVRWRRKAACPLSGVSSIVLVMGPSDDKAEVLERLPIPLTAYLGRGSDKLIGNGERDTCYPQGTRRNRCVGGPGRDVCVTGPRNTDCVGGAGRDYCRASTGSDGCWGGPGPDVCRMGPGHDGCHGEGGRDRLFGGASSDQLYGGRGNDYCDGGPGRGRSHACERGPRH